MSDQEKSVLDENARAYWKANVRLITILLVIWALVSYGAGIVFAPALNNLYIGSLPMGFWFAQQGSMYVFIILIFVYAYQMDKVDKQHSLEE